MPILTIIGIRGPRLKISIFAANINEKKKNPPPEISNVADKKLTCKYEGNNYIHKHKYEKTTNKKRHEVSEREKGKKSSEVELGVLHGGGGGKGV